MKTLMDSRQAQTQLEKQISLLGELRNAGTRAQEFREWRQTTLTLVERIWPEQSTRAMRFRRVPFSPPSTQADDRHARESFERGCAEARRLLRLWLAEIATSGISHEPEAPQLAEAARQTLIEYELPEGPVPQTNIDPTVSTPAASGTHGSRGKPASRGAAKPSRKQRKVLGEILGLERRTPAPENAQPEMPSEFDLPAMKADQAPSKPKEIVLEPNVPVDDPESVAAPRVEPVAETSTPAAPVASSTPVSPPRAEHRPADVEDLLGMSIDAALRHASGELRRMTPPAEESVAVPPTREESLPELRAVVCYTARAFIMMAGEVEELGVPEAHCQRVRLALMDLAQHVDRGSITWDIMRDAVTLVMHYPAVGRQAVPLLLPYLMDEAA